MRVLSFALLGLSMVGCATPQPDRGPHVGPAATGGVCPDGRAPAYWGPGGASTGYSCGPATGFGTSVLAGAQRCDYEVTHHSDCGRPGRFTCECEGKVRAPKQGTPEATYNALCLVVHTVCDGRVVRAGVPVPESTPASGAPRCTTREGERPQDEAARVAVYCSQVDDRCCLPMGGWNCNNVDYDEWFFSHCPPGDGG